MPIKKLNRRIYIWLTILMCISGYTNAWGILYLNLTLTHYTGNITNIAVNLAGENMHNSRYLVLAMLSFFVGGVMGGALFYKKHVGFSKKFGLTGIFAGIVYICLNYIFVNKMSIVITTALLSGLQNALLTRYKNITTRTTHITGYITDSAVFLGRFLRGDIKSLSKFKFLIINILSFFVGAIGGVLLMPILKDKIFLPTGIMTIILGAYYLMFIDKKDVQQEILSK